MSTVDIALIVARVHAAHPEAMKQTVLITGASTGFGAAFATTFAARGWNVIATMRTPQAMPNAFVTRLDVQDRASIDAAVAAGIERFGAIDAVINNAGFGVHGVFEEATDAQVAQQFDVNVFGVMAVTRAVLPHMRARKRGVIANVTSGAGVFGVPSMALYCASKFAVEGFSEALSYELASVGVVVKLVEPGGVLDTNFNARAAGEASKSVAIADYEPFRAHGAALLERMKAARATTTSQDVADATFAAITDGTRQLRYVVTPDIRALVDARRETSETQYMALVRSQFEG